MKNRLEDEYRQLMQNETPDLWERISAGIDAKIAENNVAKDDLKNETEDIAGVVVNMEAEEPMKIKKQGANFWKKYSLPLAACIAAILCVPLMLTGFLRMASGGAKSESAAADMAAPEAFYSTTTEAEDAPAEEYFEEAVVEEEAAAEEAPAEAPGSVVEEADGANNSISQDTAADAMTEAAEAETSESMAADKEQELQDLEEEKEEVTQILTVITFAAEEVILDEERVKGTLYYLTTEEEGECTIFVPSDADFAIEQDRQLKIIVRQGNEEYDFSFIEMAE